MPQHYTYFNHVTDAIRGENRKYYPQVWRSLHEQPPLRKRKVARDRQAKLLKYAGRAIHGI